MEQITQYIRDTLQTLVERDGWDAPITVAIIGANGAVSVGRFVSGGTPFLHETVCESFGPIGFRFPVNVVLTNSRGEAARVCIESEAGEPQPSH